MGTPERNSESELPSEERHRLVRLTLCGFGTAIAFGYMILIPLKLHGLLPPHMTWIRLLAGVALLGTIPAAELLAVFCLNSDRARMIALLVIYAIGAVVILVLGFATGWR
jgi:hypothetical protein